MTARQYMIESICRQEASSKIFGGNMKRIISILLLLIFVCSIDLPLYYLYKYYYLLFCNTPRFLNYSVFTHLEINLSIPSPARVNKYGEN